LLFVASLSFFVFPWLSPLWVINVIIIIIIISDWPSDSVTMAGDPIGTQRTLSHPPEWHHLTGYCSLIEVHMEHSW
jgi:hypothetical protein